MPDKNCDKNREWIVVSELRVDGCCSTLSDSKDEVPVLSNDEESGRDNRTQQLSEEGRSKVLPVKYRLPTGRHGTSSPAMATESAASSPPESAGSSQHMSPRIDPSCARLHTVDDLLNPSKLRKLFSDSLPVELENGILEGEKHSQNASLRGGIKVSTAQNQEEFQRETRARSGQKATSTINGTRSARNID